MTCIGSSNETEPQACNTQDCPGKYKPDSVDQIMLPFSALGI